MKDVTIPHHEESEQLVLSCILQEPTLIYSCIVKPQHMNGKDNRELLEYMYSLKSRDIAVDKIILTNKFNEQYIYHIATLALTTINFDDFCSLVLEYHNRRLLQRASQKLYVASEQEEDYGSVLDIISGTLKELEGQEKTKNVFPSIYNTLEQFSKNDAPLAKIGDTGLLGLDLLLGGLVGGRYYVIGGRPGIGKSTLAMNIRMNLLKSGVQTCLFSLEMLDVEIHERVLSYVGQVESWKLKNGNSEAIEKVADELTKQAYEEKVNIYDDVKYIDDIERIIAKEVSLGTQAVFIDYVQLIKIKGKYSENINARLEHINSTLKSMALRYRIPIVGLAQLSRSKDPAEKPTQESFRGSGSFEQDADCLIAIYNYDEYMGEVDISVIKNRQGKIGDLCQKYNRPFFTIYDK